MTDKRADALAFVRRYRLTYPVVSDQQDAISRRCGILGSRTTVVIDGHGRIAVQLLGPQDLGELTGALRRLRSAARRGLTRQQDWALLGV